MNEADLTSLNLLEPATLIGLFIGGMLPFLFSSLTMNAVGRAAQGIVVEVRRQFREITGLMEGKAEPDYARCVDICTRSAQKEMILPALVGIISPIAVGLLLGPYAVASMLAGAVVTGFILAIMMSNSGGAWDNAKKYIEAGNNGGKGSDAHKAAVVGDTVGDPFKDTSGPSINILIKLLSMVSIVFAGLFMNGSLIDLFK
jgi:K(+)-stimulated pyrophosphate-energized sodium pump